MATRAPQASHQLLGSTLGYNFDNESWSSTNGHLEQATWVDSNYYSPTL
jgi:hypothetical protein